MTQDTFHNFCDRYLGRFSLIPRAAEIVKLIDRNP